MLNETRLKELVDEVFQKVIKEQEQSNDSGTAQTPQAKTTVVKFDTNTSEPFEVKFSERGFSIGDTRMSFETLETALSKNYDIVLEQGKGLYLNQVRMQKILKYKDLY